MGEKVRIITNEPVVVGQDFSFKWKPTRKLGQGSFGSVYEVVNTCPETSTDKGPLKAALKVERTKGKNQVLNLEAMVLKKLSQSRSVHSIPYLGAGTTPCETFNFLLMGIAGRNLGVIRRHCLGMRYTPSSTLRIGIQAIEALREVHSIGYLHRDVKPTNFALGIGPEDTEILYLFDFGLAKKYADLRPDFTLRPIRKEVGFRGTTRYCSLTTHRRMELGRADDLISVIYMLIELYTSRLPWRGISDKLQVQYLKETTPLRRLMRRTPAEFERMYRMLMDLPYETRPPYEEMMAQLEGVLTRNDYPTQGTFPESCAFISDKDRALLEIDHRSNSDTASDYQEFAKTQGSYRISGQPGDPRLCMGATQWEREEEDDEKEEGDPEPISEDFFPLTY